MIHSTPIPDLLVIEPVRHEDDRGFFSEVWNARSMAEAGLAYDWVQDNHSRSERAGTLRGLHFQTAPAQQAKLVRCLRGRIWDVAVDIRPGSDTWGQWFGLELGEQNWRQLLIPRGFLHGFVTLTPGAEVLYKTDAHYSPAHDRTIAWNDPTLNIDWPSKAPILSAKDRDAPRLSDLHAPFVSQSREVPA